MTSLVTRKIRLSVLRLVSLFTKVEVRGITGPRFPLEVINKELQGRTLLDVPGYERKVEFGDFTHFKYPIHGSEEKIEVVTTQPETMFGNTAIAVYPNDERYRHLIGKKAKHPFLDRLLSIIADGYVDPEFGTGAVKITTARDAQVTRTIRLGILDFS